MPNSTIFVNDTLATAQREVQRKLGRCMLRLQQVERLLKALVPHISLEGEIKHLQSIQEKQIVCAKTKTLGGLVSMLTGELLSPALSDAELSDDDPDDVDDVGELGWIKHRHRISMSADDYEKTRMALTNLVDMRNGLVHHFLERFDIGLVSDCHKADAYLDECYAQIDSQLASMQHWTKSMRESIKLTAAYMASQEFADALVHGIMPDGLVHWSRTTIVECLRNAELACAQNGWTLLDSAIAHVRKSEPEQIPTKYHCKTWRQVLKKSEQFEIREDVNPLNGRGQVWYRSLEDIGLS
jgi:hypothetical protein